MTAEEARVLEAFMANRPEPNQFATREEYARANEVYHNKLKRAMQAVGAPVTLPEGTAVSSDGQVWRIPRRGEK